MGFTSCERRESGFGPSSSLQLRFCIQLNQNIVRGYAASQTRERDSLSERHRLENLQFHNAVEARAGRDRAAEVQERRQQALDREREREDFERGYGRERDFTP